MAQHAQLDAMLRRQAENRQQMQTIIAAHQERITQRIKVSFLTTPFKTRPFLETRHLRSNNIEPSCNLLILGSAGYRKFGE